MFARLLVWMLRNRRLALLALVLLSVPCAIATSSLRLDPRWTNALPGRDPLIEEYLEIIKDPLRGSMVYVLLDGPRAQEAADRFADAWRAIPEVRYVQGAGEDVYPWELVLLSRGELQGLRELAEHPAIDEYLQLLYRKAVAEEALPSVEDGEEFYGYARELTHHFASASEGDAPGDAERSLESLFTSRRGLWALDRSALLIRLGTSISEGSIEELDRFATALKNVNSDLELDFPDLRVAATGYPVTASDEMRRIRRSGRRLTIWALLIIAATMTLFMGDFREVLASLGILLLALLWTMGLVRVFFGDLNTVTMIMGLVLLGLGIDFCIHWVNYFRIGQRAGLQGNTLVLYVFGSVKRPIFAGAVTSAGAFLCILILDVPSLQEFAWMSASGIILAALMVLFVLPLVVHRERPRHVTGMLVGSWIASWTERVLRRPGSVLAVFAALVILAGASVGGLRYEYNYAKLQIGGLPSYDLKEEIVERFGISSEVLVMRAEGVEHSRELKERLLAQPPIARVESISDYQPPRTEQAMRARLIEDIRGVVDRDTVRVLEEADLEDIRELIEILVEVLPARAPDDETRPRLVELSKSLARLAEALHPGALSELNRLNLAWVDACRESLRKRSEQIHVSAEDLPQSAEFAFATSDPGVYLLYAFPAANVWEQDAAEVLEKSLVATAPMATGLSRISFRLTEVFMSKGARMSFMVLLVVFFALRVCLGSWAMTYLASLPLICGGILTAGTLVWLGIPINFYNLAGLPIILGIGVDDGVHLVNAFQADGRREPVEAVRLTGGAILLTSLTSMIGFGCLGFYEHPGMATLGIVLFVGVAWCLVITLVLLPIMLLRLSGRRGLI